MSSIVRHHSLGVAPDRAERRYRVSALAIAVAIAMPVPAFAATQSLEEVIVTARKREENLQALPQAISALQADQLEAAQINNVQNLQNIIPNVTIGNGASVGAANTLNAVIRGIGNEAGFAPGVGIYVDDVYLATANGSLLDVYDIERIEVLKGPQGNLYGRNTIGGAIRYITRDPSDQVRGFAQGKIGSFNQREVTAGISGPLVDDLVYGGVALTRKKQDGYQKNLGDGRHYASVDSWAGRGTLKITPSDNFSIKWVSDYYYDRGLPKLGKRIFSSLAYIYGGPMYGTPYDPTIGWNPGKNEVSSYVTDPTDNYIKTLTHALTMNWDINDEWSLKSISAYRYSGYGPKQDLDGSVTRLMETNQSVLNAARSQEFQANYSGDGVDGVVGFYYFREREVTPMQSLFFGYAAGGYDFDRESFAVSRNYSKALYTSWDFDLTDDLHLTLGGRYNWDHSDAQYSQTEDFPYSPYVNGPLFIDYGTSSFAKSWHKFTKTAKLAYDVSPDTMVYVGYSEGYKQGGFNTQGGVISIGLGKSTYDPENVKTYTAGFKTTLLDNTLRINSEWFYNDYRDKLVRVIESNPMDPTVILQINENAGAVYTTGVDTDISWLTPLQGLTINASVGYLQTVIDKYEASQWNSTGTGLVNPDSASNFRMGYSPRWTVNLGPVYTVNVDKVGTVQLSATAAYRSSSYAVSPTNITAAYADSVKIGDNTMYNASIALTTEDARWRFALEGRNLSNVRVLSDAFDMGSVLFTSGAYTDPRTWSLSARYQYE